jgi:hypothetical protein
MLGAFQVLRGRGKSRRIQYLHFDRSKSLFTFWVKEDPGKPSVGSEDSRPQKRRPIWLGDWTIC